MLQAQEKTEEGKALYAAGNRMGAIKAFEEALEEVWRWCCCKSQQRYMLLYVPPYMAAISYF